MARSVNGITTFTGRAVMLTDVCVSVAAVVNCDMVNYVCSVDKPLIVSLSRMVRARVRVRVRVRFLHCNNYDLMKSRQD
jgi:hypothetical protein